MALGPDELLEIDGVLSAPDADARVFAQLRSRFPHLSWTRCDASDVTDREDPSQGREHDAGVGGLFDCQPFASHGIGAQ